MAARTVSKGVRSAARKQVAPLQWAKIGLTAALVAVGFVLLVQAAALSLWPEAAAFKPLDSYARSAIFTLIPALVATGVFAWLSKGRDDPATLFAGIALVVLVISIIPDYLMPDPNKTLLASTITAFLHVVAGIIITAGLVVGYRRAARSI
jgi:hypothetical protein